MRDGPAIACRKVVMDPMLTFQEKVLLISANDRTRSHKHSHSVSVSSTNITGLISFLAVSLMNIVTKRDEVSKACESAGFIHLHADEHVQSAVLMAYAFA